VASIAVHGLLFVTLPSNTDNLPLKAAHNDVLVELIDFKAGGPVQAASANTTRKTHTAVIRRAKNSALSQVHTNTQNPGQRLQVAVNKNGLSDVTMAQAGTQAVKPVPKPLPGLNGGQVTHLASNKKAAGRLDERKVARRVRATSNPNHKKAAGRLDERKVARRVRANGPNHKKTLASSPFPTLASMVKRDHPDTRSWQDRIPQQTIRPASSRQEQRADVQAVRKSVRNHLEAFKYYPASARRRGIEGEVDVSFFLTGGGLASRLKVLRGSGYAVLDRAALKTVARAQPFPVDYGEYRFRLHFRRL